MEKQKEVKEEHKKQTEEKASEEHSSHKNENRDRQALFLLGGFALLIIVVVGIFIYNHSLAHFTFNGIKFDKIREGSVVFYSAKVPIYDSNNQVSSYFTADFRTNPNNLKNIPTNLSYIKFIKSKDVYLAYEDLKVCEDNGIAAAGLALFLSQTGIKVKGALTNQTLADSMNMTYATCETNPDNTVIVIENGEETRIDQLSNNCYHISSKDCDILKALEKFELQVLEDYVKSLG